MTFESLSIIPPILKALEKEGYTHPTPVQEEAIPHLLQGRDLLGSARTGTGKTAAFSIPILQKLYENKSSDRKRKIRGLIITPTRELAVQVLDSLKAYGKNTGLFYTAIYGGVKQFQQVSELRRGIDILVATPGRLMDLIDQGLLDLGGVEVLVLDEADRMLDMGFINDIKKVISYLPENKQSVFFSATMPAEIVKLSSSILRNPARVDVIPPPASPNLITQQVYFVDRDNKGPLLIELLKKEEIKHALVFTRTKHGADKLLRILHKNEVSADVIHGDKSQAARQKALNNFKAKKARVLVATDVAARGIDVDDLEYVINYDIPEQAENYVHRIGRTGRAGMEGIAISFCDNQEKYYLRDIEKHTKLKPIPMPLPKLPERPKPDPQEKQQEVKRQENKPSSFRKEKDANPSPNREESKRPAGKSNFFGGGTTGSAPKTYGARKNDQRFGRRKSG